MAVDHIFGGCVNTAHQLAIGSVIQASSGGPICRRFGQLLPQNASRQIAQSQQITRVLVCAGCGAV